MNRREAKRVAYSVAHSLIDGALRDGGALMDAAQDAHALSEDDVARLHAALDDIAQQLWERAHPQPRS